MTFWLILLFICHTVNRPYVFCLQLVTKIFKDDIELETYITSAHYGVCSEVRYVLFFFVRADKKANSSLVSCRLQKKFCT